MTPTFIEPHHKAPYLLVKPLIFSSLSTISTFMLGSHSIVTTLTWLPRSKTTKTVPHELWYFLQYMVQVRGYVMPGSEIDEKPIPGSQYAQMVAAADNSTEEILTQQLLLTVYPDHRQAS